MRATILLADYAEAGNGKVNAMGLGWSQTSAPTMPMALVILLKVPWNESNRQIPLKVELLDADGRLVELGPANALGQRETFTLEAQFEVGRPPGVPPGSELDGQFTVNIGSLPLEAGESFEFRMSVDGRQRSEWSASFFTRPATPGQPGHPGA